MPYSVMAEGRDELQAAAPSRSHHSAQQASTRPRSLTIEFKRSDLAFARPADVRRLQRAAGNRAVANALKGSATRILAREPPALAEDKGTAILTPIAGQPFVTGTGETADVSPSDVHQGKLGDCNLLAPLAAVARAKPAAIRRLITRDDDGTYNVTLFERSHFWSDLTPRTIRVASQFYTDSSGNPYYAGYGSTGGANELWVMLIEKAFAKWKGSYDAADGSMFDRDGLELITGNDATESAVSDGSEDDLLKAIQGSLAAGYALTVNTSTSHWQNWWENDEDKKRMDTYKIIKGHAYSIEAVDRKAKTVNLRNPWGRQHLTGLPASVFRQYPFSKWSGARPS
jgi:Calpain family cysteine protease